VGTYEGILFGFDGDWKEEKNVKSLNIIQSFIYASHSGCVRCINSYGKFMVSGGIDETIKSYDILKKKRIGDVKSTFRGDYLS